MPAMSGFGLHWGVSEQLMDLIVGIWLILSVVGVDMSVGAENKGSDNFGPLKSPQETHPGSHIRKV